MASLLAIIKCELMDTLYKIKRILEKLCAYSSGMLIIIISILALWQVFSRYVLNSPSTNTEESLRYLMIWMGFLGAAYCFGQDNHLSLTLLENKLHETKKKSMKIMQNIVVNITIFLVLVCGGYIFVTSSVDQTSSTLGWSMSIIYLIMPLSGILILILNLINLVGLVKYNQE